jgi:hypothetical protein
MTRPTRLSPTPGPPIPRRGWEGGGSDELEWDGPNRLSQFKPERRDFRNDATAKALNFSREKGSLLSPCQASLEGP